MQIRRFSGDVTLASERELKQRRSLRGDGEQPDQRATHAARAAARIQVAASAPNRPPTS